MLAIGTPTGVGNPSIPDVETITPGFTQTGTVSLSATDSSGRVELPASGNLLIIRNYGSSTAYVTLGGASVTSTTSGYPIDPYTYDVLNRTVASQTYLAAICAASGTASLSISAGTGSVTTDDYAPAFSAAVTLQPSTNNIGDVDVLTLPVGQAAMAASTPVVIASNQSSVPTTPALITAGTATLSNVGDSASSVTVLAANASRKGAIIVNDSTAVLYLKFGATASTSSFTYKLSGGESLELPSQPVYTGIIDGIWASDAGGNARVTELT